MKGPGEGVGEGSALEASGAPPPVHTLAVPSPHEDAQTRHPQGSPLLWRDELCVQGHQSPAEEAAELEEVWVEELGGQIPARPDWTAPQSSSHPAPQRALSFPRKLETWVFARSPPFTMEETVPLAVSLSHR